MSYREDPPIVHIHRLTGGDWPYFNTFNGQTYPAADWLPLLLSARATYTPGVVMPNFSGTNQDWAVNAGNWGIQFDWLGTTESWVVVIAFIKVGSANIRRFGGI